MGAIINTQTTITMPSLEKLIGAKFLVDAKFKSVYEQPSYLNEINLPENEVQKIIKSHILNKTSKAIIERFEKEIHVEKTERSGLIFNRYELEFMAFTMPEFKYIVEYIISQMTMEQLIEIHSKYNYNATSSNL